MPAAFLCKLCLGSFIVACTPPPPPALLFFNSEQHSRDYARNIVVTTWLHIFFHTFLCVVDYQYHSTRCISSPVPNLLLGVSRASMRATNLCALTFFRPWCRATYQAIVRHINFQLIKCLLLGSPGFVKDDFFEYLNLEAVRRDERVGPASLVYLAKGGEGGREGRSSAAFTSPLLHCYGRICIWNAPHRLSHIENLMLKKWKLGTFFLTRVSSIHNQRFANCSPVNYTVSPSTLSFQSVYKVCLAVLLYILHAIVAFVEFQFFCLISRVCVLRCGDWLTQNWSSWLRVCLLSSVAINACLVLATLCPFSYHSLKIETVSTGTTIIFEDFKFYASYLLHDTKVVVARGSPSPSPLCGCCSLLIFLVQNCPFMNNTNRPWSRTSRSLYWCTPPRATREPLKKLCPSPRFKPDWRARKHQKRSEHSPPSSTCWKRTRKEPTTAIMYFMNLFFVFWSWQCLVELVGCASRAILIV